MYLSKLALTLLFVGLSAQANTAAQTAQNPQIRACRIAGGEFMVVNAPQDQIGLCKFGPALVGSIDILNRDNSPASLNQYSAGVTECLGSPTTLQTFDGINLKFCSYPDGSLVDLETLTAGKNDPRNSELNKALGL